MSQRQFGPSNGGPIDLSDTDLSGAALRYATLTGADFSRATLVAADLVHSRLDGADLTASDLTDSVFDYADLAGAQLEGAIVVGASFANARNLTQEQIAVAHGDASTVLPAALMPPTSWFPQLEEDVFREYPVPDRMMADDLYEVLGVSSIAKADEIRSSFRNLVKKYHPDLNPDDATAQETFKQVSTAYRILSDPEKRARYDRGEIGTDGEISPEFAAKKQFRRYAFRFYAAATMSLLLAGSVLGVVWRSVLVDDERGRVAIAVATPPKTIERLDPNPWSDPGTRGGTALRPQTEVRAPQSVTPPPATRLQAPEPEPDEDGDEKTEAQMEALQQAEALKAGAESGPDGAGGVPDDSAPSAIAGKEPPTAAPAGPALSQAGEGKPEASADQRIASLPETQASDPAPGQPAQQDTPAPAVQSAAPPGEQTSANAGAAEVQPAPPPGPGGTARPLGEDHSDKEARPAQADAAGSATPAANPARPAPQGAGLQAAKAGWRDTLVRLRMRAAPGSRASRDALSDLFRARAVKTTLGGEDRSQSTASVDPLAPRERPEDQEEIWDLYTHSLPEEQQAGEDRPWPAALKPEPRRAAVPARIPNVIAKAPERAPRAQVAQEQQQPNRTARRQAVSEILGGGL